MSEQPGTSKGPEDWQRRWKEESAWSARELARLCCGWRPDNDIVSDPSAYEHAKNLVLRAVRVGDLQPIDLKGGLPATREELFYGDAPLFRPRAAAAWAAKRFPHFPYGEDDWRASAPTIAELTVGDNGQDRDPRAALRKHRYALIDAYGARHGLPTRKAFCRQLGISVDTLGGIVRDEPAKCSPAAKAKLLTALGIREGDWNTPP